MSTAIRAEVIDLTEMRQLVSDRFKQENRDVDATIRSVLDWYDLHPDNKNQVTSMLIYNEIRNLVYEAMRASRRLYPVIAAQAKPLEESDFRKVLVAKAQKRYDELMSYPVFGGKPLGDCVKVELQDYSKTMIASGRTELHRGRWLALVAKNLKGNATVRESLREADLKRFLRQARAKD